MSDTQQETRDPRDMAPDPRQVEAGRVRRQRATTGETVTVACKMPGGLILRTYDMVKETKIVNNTTVDETVAKPTGHEYILNGYAINMADIQAGNMPEHLIVGGFGLTPGIPKDFWERWLHDNRDTALVRNRVVWACDTDLGASSEAKNSRSVRSGLEPLDPNNLPPDVRGRRTRGGGISDIQRGTSIESDVDNL